MDIGVWGDSITYGAGDSEALGWVGRLRKECEKRDEHAGVYNFGICGDTTEDLLARFEIEAKALQPDTILFAVGTNDAAYRAGSSTTRVPLEEYKKNMQMLITQAKAFTEKVILIGLTRADEDHTRKSGTVFSNATTVEYNNCLRALAASESVAFVDVIDTVDSATDLADGLHPNAQGYEKMFQTILRALV